MDLHHLNQALPVRGYDADQDLQAPFRAAALGIATFYKRATESGRKAYQAGYSAGLQDVLEYLQAGLDHGADSKRQGSEERMAVTIERVMDYIERRQEALRGDISESGDDEGSGPPTARPLPQAASTAPTRATLAPTSQARRTSPRRPLAEHPIPQPSAPPSPVTTASTLAAPQPTPTPSPGPPALEFPFTTFPFNFNPFLPSNTSHHGHGHPRRGGGGRKGKGRDRDRDRADRADRTASADPSTSASHPSVPVTGGYVHYAPVAGPEAESGSGKRRFTAVPSPPVEELRAHGEENADEVMADGERPSKRLTRR